MNTHTMVKDGNEVQVDPEQVAKFREAGYRMVDEEDNSEPAKPVKSALEIEIAGLTRPEFDALMKTDRFKEVQFPDAVKNLGDQKKYLLENFKG